MENASLYYITFRRPEHHPDGARVVTKRGEPVRFLEAEQAQAWIDRELAAGVPFVYEILALPFLG
jgi:hypothetical protein